MDAYAVGFVVGRLLASFFIVLVIMLLFSRFNLKAATRKTAGTFEILQTTQNRAFKTLGCEGRRAVWRAQQAVIRL